MRLDTNQRRDSGNQALHAQSPTGCSFVPCDVGRRERRSALGRVLPRALQTLIRQRHAAADPAFLDWTTTYVVHRAPSSTPSPAGCEAAGDLLCGEPATDFVGLTPATSAGEVSTTRRTTRPNVRVSLPETRKLARRIQCRTTLDKSSCGHPTRTGLSTGT